MEELHAVASAYYDRGNDDTRLGAYDFFRSMDTDGDGRISYDEFNDFVRQSGCNWILQNYPNLFAKLDRNRDGDLDFWEVLMFYYIIKTRYITCRSCREFCGLYFTCVECFDHDHPTYDLCAACYGNGNYSHEHSSFLDNHVLLRSKRDTPPAAPPNHPMAVASPNPQVITNNNYYGALVPAAPQRQRNIWLQAVRALDTVLSIADMLSNCTIM